MIDINTDLYAGAGLAPATLVCFETLESLIENGIVSQAELMSIKTPLDKFEFINTVTIRVIMSFIESGVEFLSLDGIVISPYAKIGKGTTIHPGVQIRRNVVIGQNCVIGTSTVIEDSTIGDNVFIDSSRIYSSTLDDGVSVGPFSQVRAGSHLKKGVKIGDFVEIKNSVLGEGTKAAHLTYIGDSDVGARVNFGCGTVTCNYNGYVKERCTIGDNAFIGCNTNLIAPVTVGNGAYIAAGSTITDSVPPDSLAIARARGVIKENWAIDFAKKNQRK